MSAQELLNNPETDKIGWLVVLTGWFMGLWNWLTEHGNETIVVISGILGMIFLFFKIKLTVTEYKIKRKELKKLENENVD